MPEREPPRFTGVRTYIDPQGRFNFRYPTGWHEFQLDEREGVLFSPEVENPTTYFSVWIERLDASIVADDFEDLRLGVNEGLAQLADVAVERQADDLMGNLAKFERIYTFRDGDIRRKRKVWVMYAATWLIVVTWQGATEEEYEYWLPMGNYSFAHFTLPQSLWFATDPTLAPTGGQGSGEAPAG